MLLLEVHRRPVVVVLDEMSEAYADLAIAVADEIKLGTAKPKWWRSRKGWRAAMERAAASKLVKQDRVRSLFDELLGANREWLARSMAHGRERTARMKEDARRALEAVKRGVDTLNHTRTTISDAVK